MFISDLPNYYLSRGECGDCGCRNDHIGCSTEQNRIRESGEVTVVEAGPGEKTTFYPKTGILMLSKKFMMDGYHNITFGKWGFWSSIYYPDQIFVRRNEYASRNPNEMLEVLESLNKNSIFRGEN